MALSKVCRGCNEDKPLERFFCDMRYKNPIYASKCRDCYNAKAREERAKRNPNFTRKSTRSPALIQAAAKYRARRRLAIVEHVDYGTVYLRDKGICHICSQYSPLEDTEFDHVIPLAKGGEHSYANIKVSHGTCNRTKSDRLTA